MNKHVTPILLGLLIAVGPACDSNPTPHPGHNDVYKTDTLGPDSAYGEFTGDNEPGRNNDEDQDPTATPDNDGATGGFENCPPGDQADATTSGDSADAEDAADAEEDVAEGADGADCGPEEVTPPPGAAEYDDDDKVE
jgi:hypothetical protein